MACAVYLVAEVLDGALQLRYFIGGQRAFAADRIGLVDLRQFQAFPQAGDGLAQFAPKRDTFFN